MNIIPSQDISLNHKDIDKQNIDKNKDVVGTEKVEIVLTELINFGSVPTANELIKKPPKREHKPTPKAEQQVDEDTIDSGEAASDDDEDYKEEQEFSSSESDDDNDMDFSMKDRFGKKEQKHKQGNKKTFKDFLGTVEVRENEPTKKKYTKSPKNAPVQQKPSTSGKIVSLTNRNTPPPVIIKKVIQAQPMMTVTNNNLVREESAAQFVPLTVNFMKTQLATQISIQSSIPPLENKEEIKFVELLVQDLEKAFPGAAGVELIEDVLIAASRYEVIDESLNQNELLECQHSGNSGSVRPLRNSDVVTSSVSPPPHIAATKPPREVRKMKKTPVTSNGHNSPGSQSDEDRHPNKLSQRLVIARGREMMRKTLKSAIEKSMKDSKEPPKMTPNEVEQYVKDV